MRGIKKLLLVLVVALSTVGCDQVTKNYAKTNIQNSTPVSFFHDMVRLEYAENPGAMLSIGADWPFHIRFWLLTVLTGIFLLAVPVYVYFHRDMRWLQVAGLSLALGGGASNLIDRWVNDGKVIDFLNIGIASIRTGIFNLADVSVLMGFCIFLTLSTHWKRHSVESGPESL